MAPGISRQDSRKDNKPAPKESEPQSDSDSDSSASEGKAQEQDEGSDDIEEPLDEESEDEKDEMELELEKLVFGDSAGFRDGLKSFGEDARDAGRDEDMDLDHGEDDGDTAGLGGLADSDLFFVDSGPSDHAVVRSAPIDDDEQNSRDQAAWEDSDDERLLVSLASVPRLRKLRRTETEDVVTGKEFSRRLRMQFERLNPPPDWAQPQKQNKRRRKSQAGDSEEDSSNDDMDIDQELSAQPLAKLLKDSDALIKSRDSRSAKKRKLAPEKISISRLKDIPGEQPSAISSLSFHPSYPLLLSSGIAKTVWLHHVHPYPPIPNPLITSLHIKGTPLDTTAFHPDPKENRIFLSSRRRHYHIWDLQSGFVTRANRALANDRDQTSMERFVVSPTGSHLAFAGPTTKSSGIVTVISAATSQLIAHARTESPLADFAWWVDGSGLSIVGTGGEVSEYSLMEQRFLAIWQDDGALHTTTLALGGRSGSDQFFGGDRWVALGSRSGIVSIYDRKAWIPSKSTSTDGKTNMRSSKDKKAPLIPRRPTPFRTLDNLVTSISTLRFAPDGQVLVMASRLKQDALRLVHLPSGTVYQNWPTQQTPLGRVTSVAWARGSILEEGEGEGNRGRGTAMYVLAVGNDRGAVRMWEVGL